jgi:Virulence protein
MREYIGHNNILQEVMLQKAAKPENAGARMVQTDFFAYICMFTTLFNYTMEKKNKKQSLKKKPSIPVAESLQSSDARGEIVLYQPDDTISLEVRLEADTVWLTQSQMVELFHRDQSVIARHISNIYKEKELKKEGTYAKFAYMGHDGLQEYEVSHYSLDVIISVGYRVKSKQGTRFRQWANGVIKNYLINGYAVNQQIKHIEQRFDDKLEKQQNKIQKIESTLAEQQNKIDFFVRTNMPPIEGVLFEGQIFDAYKLVEALIKSAKKEIILIDNYINASVFDLLEKREQGVHATIYTESVGQSLTHIQELSQKQHGRNIELKEYNSRFHDRFLILDDALYHFGASFKDLGKRLFAFELMGIDKDIILNQL